MNLLAAGKAPQQMSVYLAGCNLTALSMNKPNCLINVRPIAVGEVLRRLTSKCLCYIIRDKAAADFFHPFQQGVACSCGAEKIIHRTRLCIDEH